MYMDEMFQMTKCLHLTCVRLFMVVAWQTSIISWCILADGHSVCDIYEGMPGRVQTYPAGVI